MSLLSRNISRNFGMLLLRKQKNYPAKFSVQIFPISYGCELGLGGDEQYVKFEFNGYELFNGCPVS